MNIESPAEKIDQVSRLLARSFPKPVRTQLRCPDVRVRIRQIHNLRFSRVQSELEFVQRLLKLVETTFGLGPFREEKLIVIDIPEAA